MNARGFTLLELMVGGAVGVFAVMLVLSVFITQNGSFQSLDLVRQMNASGRDASLELENSLKRAGYGIDPNIAFDFTCPGQAAGTKCHDSYNGSDDLRFYARNPNYRYTPQNAALGCSTAGGCLGGGEIWSIANGSLTSTPTTATLTVSLATGDALQKGRIVLMICNDSTHPVYGVVTDQLLSGPLASAVVHINLNTSTSSTSLVGETTTSACHGNGNGFLLLVDQYHYYITTLNNEPWLVLDNGITYDATNATNNLIPVARGVEDMQVAYQIGIPNVSPLPAAPDSNQDWLIGNNLAAAAVEEPNPGATAPQSGATNGSMHPGNIRAVRVSFVVRSPLPDVSFGNAFLGDPAIQLENRSDVSAIAAAQYRRLPITLSVGTRNMASANPNLLF